MPKKQGNDSDDEAEDNDERSSKSPKKKYYPFGTPSLMKPVYSQFVHLDSADRSFATSLAVATGIEAKVDDGQEEEKKKAKKAKKSKDKKDKKEKKKKGKDEENQDEENDGFVDMVPDMEGMEPCTRPVCVKVLEKIGELQQNNQDERDELEEEYDELQFSLEEITREASVASAKLFEVSEVTKQLELTYEAMLMKAEQLEKSKEIMQQDRTEINSKILTLELEKRKLASNLEQTKKMLADAMWRKKKQSSSSESQESGLNSANSLISEYPIVQANVQFMKKSLNLHHTSYNKHVNSGTLDETEFDPKVKSMSFYLREKLIYEPKQFDKYSDAFYDKLSRSCNQSREGQDDLVLKYLDRRENRIKYSGIEAQSKRANTARQSSPSPLTDTTAGDNFGSLSVELSGGPTLFYYDPDGSRAIRSIASARSSRRNTRGGSGGIVDGGPSMSSTIGSSSGNRLRGGSQSMKSKSPGGGRLQPLRKGEAGFEGSIGGNDNTNSSSYDISSWGGGIDTGSFDRSNADNGSSASKYAPQLDPVFLKESARTGWGRKHKLGMVRKPRAMDQDLDGRSNASASMRGNPQNVKTISTQYASDKSMGAGEPSIAWRSKLLTAQHPGMECFNEALTMENLKSEDWG